MTTINNLIVQIEVPYEDTKTKKVIQTEWKYSDLTDDVEHSELELYPKNKLLQMSVNGNEFGFIQYLSFKVHSLEEIGEDEEPHEDQKIEIGDQDDLNEEELKTIDIEGDCVLRYVYGSFESALKSTSLPCL